MRRTATRVTLAAAAVGFLALPCAARAAPLPSGTTVRASVGSHGQQARGPATVAFADHPAVSADGRIITFTSNAGDLTPDCGRAEANGLLGFNVYARNLATGATELVSQEAGGCPTRAGSDQPLTSSVSDDGRFVAFSNGGSMVHGFTLGREAHTGVYVRDRVRKRTMPVSIGYDGRGNNADAQFPAISGNGRYVVFESGASNLVRHDPLGRPDNLVQDLYVRDLLTGRTERVGSAHPRSIRVEKVNASISRDGRWISYETADASLFSTRDYGPTVLGQRQFPAGTGPTQVFLYDRVAKVNRMLSLSPEGFAGNSDSNLGNFRQAGNHTVSADGRYVVFVSDANNLLIGDPAAAARHDLFSSFDGAPDVYLYDRFKKGLTRVTVGPGGIAADMASANPAVSADGRWVAFESGASNLGPVDVTMPVVGGSGIDIYVYDRQTATHQLVSASTEGQQAALDAGMPAVSGDGRIIAFTSAAPNLVLGDTNGLPDVFAHRRAA